MEVTERRKEAASSETRQRKARVKTRGASPIGDTGDSGLAAAMEENKEEEAEESHKLVGVW